MAEINFVKAKATVEHKTFRERLLEAKGPAKVAGIAVAVLVILVGLIVLIVNVVRVDYEATVAKMQEVETKVSAFLSSSACETVVSAANLTTPTVEDYKIEVRRCKNLTGGAWDAVRELGETEGVSRNDAVRAEYERFVEALKVALPDDAGLDEKLEVYGKWHEYVIGVSLMSYGGARSEFERLAGLLTGSENQVLASYGADWLRKTVAVANTYAEYEAAGKNSAERIELRATYERRKKAVEEWEAAERPDVTKVLPLGFGETEGAASALAGLYDIILKVSGEER